MIGAAARRTGGRDNSWSESKSGMGSWKIGKAFGIGLYVHWTFLLLPMYVLFMVAPLTDLLTGMFYVVGVCCVFGCVLLHELGHAVMARHFGIATKDITLYPIGGVARLERMSEKPGEEFWIAVAGPAVNVAIVALLSPLLFLLCGIDNGMQYAQRILSVAPPGEHLFAYPLAGQLLVFLSWCNIVLVLFNMLPIFPMDGGRVLRALLSKLLGHLHGTEVATALAMMMAGLMAFWGLGFFENSRNPMLVLVALFVFMAGQQELAMVRHKAAHPEAAANGQPPVEWYYVLDKSTAPPEPQFTGYTWDRKAGVWIEWREGRPIQGCFME
jgi:Zn-dependent protease